MSILDRYVLRAWVGAFAVATLALLGFYLVADLLAHMDGFLHAQNVNRLVLFARYYGVRLPIFFVWVAPMISLCAMMLTLTRFARANEIVPVLVSGRSSRRFLLPAFAATGMVSLAMFWVDERVAPRLGEAFRETERIVQGGGKDITQLVLSDSNSQDWFAEKFHPGTNSMEKVLVVKLGGDFRRFSDVKAETAEWKRSRGGWLLKNGVETTYDAASQRRTERKALPEEGLLVISDLKPQDVNEADQAIRMSTLSQLEHNIEQFPFQPFWRVQWHSKWTMPLSNMVLLLIGVPLLMRSGSKNVFVGVGISVGLGIGFFALILAFLDAGNAGRMDAVTAAWFPIVLFGAIGVAMMDAIST
ncbi:MAG: LptF/LptG family permease [Planctomycetes bacterium]|nr:LptF/LptG family permease [Planctomycetota bacterium]